MSELFYYKDTIIPFSLDWHLARLSTYHVYVYLASASLAPLFLAYLAYINGYSGDCLSGEKFMPSP